VQTGLFALQILCALAALAFAAEAAVRPRRWLPLAAAAAATLTASFLSTRAPDVSALAALLAAGALSAIVWPHQRPTAAALSAGVATGVGLALMRQEGAPAWVAALLAIVPTALAWWLSQSRPRFAPLAMRDEALVLLLVIGVAVALLPGVLDGWRTAVSLNVSAGDPSRLALPSWALAVSGAAIALGGCYSAWRHR
jgi:hypothetical protein